MSASSHRRPRSFIVGRPVFCTLIALAVDGVPVMGERWLGARRHATALNGVTARTRLRLGLRRHPARDLSGISRRRCGRPFRAAADAAKFTIYDASTQGYGLVARGHADIMIAASYGIANYLAAVQVIEGAGNDAPR